MSKQLTLEKLQDLLYKSKKYPDREISNATFENVLDQLIDMIETKPDERSIKDILYDYLRHNIRLGGYYNGEDIFIRLYFDDKLLDECQFRIQTRD